MSRFGWRADPRASTALAGRRAQRAALVLLFGALCTCPAGSLAQSTPGSSVLSPWGVDIHAFVSQGFLYTTDNNYLAKSQHGSAEFTEIGLNFAKDVTDRLRMGVQLFSRDLGPIGNYKPQLDWAYLDYRFFNWLGVRAGRTKIPFGLYNEINDVDVARVPVLLPQSMYPIENRDALLSVTGAELYGYVPLGLVGQLEYRAYGGTIFVDTNPAIPVPYPDIAISDFHVPYVFGGRLMWLTPVDGLQMGGGLQALRFDTEYTISPAVREPLVMGGVVAADGKVPTKLPLRLWITSIEYSAHNLLLAAEYGRWMGDLESSVPALLPNVKVVNERFYGMASYQVTSWFAPGAYYSLFYPNVDDRKGREQYQHDIALTLRFDLMKNWLIKAEGHYMRGTAALNVPLNGGTPLSELTPVWGLFMLKTTAYF
jgi:hypothetical protein